ncbi:phenylalanine tRNA synthetase, alpha-subunit [Collimonas fungivorans Ter331]|uniref:Phenylalanine tRNA synthetase, alpha-subunit n=1 Tax=Collimonas fungivorans (strain Ter331) TaxID=1005048 RepID=G0ABD0_COLFT|nr:phenylalanine tRNA synthetase, alpha-subunit [Collimonas fungivorans Ter331]
MAIPSGAEVNTLCPVCVFNRWFLFYQRISASLEQENCMNSLEQLVTQAQADFSAAADAAALENAKAKYLGKTGQITEQMKGLGKLAPDERKVQGAVINKRQRADRSRAECAP